MGRHKTGVKLAECREPLLGKLFLGGFSVVFSAFLASGVYALTGAAGAAGSAWGAGVLAFFLFLALNLAVYFVLHPDVSFYDRGMVVRLLWKRVFVPWQAVSQVRESPRRARVSVQGRLTALHHLLGLLLLEGRPVFFIRRSWPGYENARRVMQEKLKGEGRFLAAQDR